MTDKAGDIVQQQAAEALSKLSIQGEVTAERVAESVFRRSVYWEMPTAKGDRLVFLRFFAPVIEREEVFLGNVLFNDFLSKAFSRAIANRELGAPELVANDLENYFFLVRTNSEVVQLVDAFRSEVEESLPDLFFVEADPARGIYGDLTRMFAFRKSDFEPFPVYSIPRFLSRPLEQAVRRELDRLLDSSAFADRIRTILAAISFFYGRTSGGSGDAQSFSNFVDHLVNDMDYDGLLTAAEVAKAFNITIAQKSAVKQSIDDHTYALDELRLLISRLLERFQSSIDAGSPKWLMSFLHKDGKFVDLAPRDYVNAVLADVQLGQYPYTRPSAAKHIVPCRLCSKAPAAIEERYITTGLSSFRFDNQRIRRQAEKLCVKCGLHSYLAQKLLGTTMVSAGGKLPQVPKTHNLIFHFGKHTDEEVEHIVRSIDHIWSLVRQHRAVEQIRREVTEQKKALEAKLEREKDAVKKQALEGDLAQTQTALQQAQSNIGQVEERIFLAFPWLKASGASPIPDENVVLDTFVNIQPSESKVERHILGLGVGGYRMLLFILPQVRAPRDAEHDFAQRRFSNSRVTVTTLLSFLRELCGCDGPFYYQSLPTLTPDAFQRDTFYVRNEAVSVRQVQNEYQVVSQLAWKVVKRRKATESGAELFTRKVLLAEQLLTEPLGRFSAIMRDSAILGQTKGSYKRLAGAYRPDWKAYDLTEYAKFIGRLSELEEAE